MSDFQLDEEHPLALELASLREAALRYQHEALAASVKLQRHSVHTTRAVEHNHALELENTRLREELETLRAHPDTTPQSAALQIPELTLALRKLSDKLTTTEEILLARTTELAHAQSELGRAEHDRAAILATSSHANTRLEESEHRQRELQRRVQAAEEERMLADMVLEEYASLVRKLEGRTSKSSDGESLQSTPAANLAEGKLGLQRLLNEFNVENERVASTLHQARSENDLLRAQLDAERQRSEADRESLAKIILELDRYKADDSTAAKMVSRYMKFSQSTTDSLQKAMYNMRTRHAATVSTLNSQIEHLHKALTSERRQTEKLREALEQLSEDISREAYGRRREISLRLSFLGREEGLAESLRRWLRKSKETSDRAFSHATDSPDPLRTLRDTLDSVLHTAESLLETLNGQPVADANVPLGTVARVLAAQDAVNRLTRELQRETHLRLQAQTLLGQAGITLQDSAPAVPLQGLPLTPPQSTSSVDLHHQSHVEPAKRTDMPKEAVTQEDTTRNATAEKPDGAGLDAHPETSDGTPQTAGTEDSQATPALETDLSSAVDAPAVQPMTQLAEAPIQPSQAPADETPQPNFVPPMSETSSHPSALTAVQSEENLAPQEGPNALPSVTITPAAEEISLPPADAPVDSEATAAPSSPPDLTSSDPETTSAPALTSLPSIQELSGLDIRDLPSSSPQASPQLSDAVELPTSSAVTPATPLTVETTSATPSGVLFAPSPVVPPSAHPLVVDLQIVKQRYDHFQKAFRDCNLSLKDLKKDIADLPPSSSMTPVLKTAVERLNDVNEDTRVELEIRVADEERIISGYETLLSVPGALSSHEVDESEVRQEITAFVEGTTPSVAKALRQFSRKLDDLQHDIASIKRSLHELSSEELSPPASVPTPTKSASQGWASWTGGILGGARPVSPAPMFGSVMTTPRARQSSFGAFMHRPSLPNLHSGDRESNSPFASLDLRTPMPAIAVPQSSPSPSRGSFLLPAPGGRPQQKSRNTSSPMYMLGLGLRGSSVGFGSSPAIVGTPSRLARGSEELSEAESEDGEGVDAADSDVE